MTDFESRLRAVLDEETIDISARPGLAEDLVARGSKVRRRRRVAGGVAALAVLAAIAPVWHSIDTSGSRVPPVGPPSQVPHTHKSPSPTPRWATHPVDVVHEPTGVSHVVNLRVGRHATYDRVVIDLQGAMTGYHVGYQPALVASSGQPVALPGNAVLVIRLTAASAHDGNGRSTFLGQQTATYALPSLRGSTLIDYEGVDVGLGVRARTGFRVFELTGPTRLVVDIQH